MRSSSTIPLPSLLDVPSDQTLNSSTDTSNIFNDTLPTFQNHSHAQTQTQPQAQDFSFQRGEPPHFSSQPNPYISHPSHRRADNLITNPFNSILTMPIPGTKLAPEKFRGDFHKVKEFIQHFERLCAQNNVILDAEKCEALLRYCSKREKQTIQNIHSYITKNWGRLKSDILKLYDADLDTKRYKVRDVRAFSKKQKEKKIRNLGDWKKYCRAFLRIAGSLLAEEKIGAKEYATYFWQGIPRTLRTRLENRLLARDPIRDLSEPFDVEDIDRAAEATLQRDRFDRALDDSDSDEDDSSGMDSSSESDDESSDSESEDERERRRRRAKKKVRTKRRTTSAVEAGKVESPKKRGVSSSRKEVESLIKQMNLLAQDDPEYGLAYYRALKLDPDVSRVIGRPMLKSVNTYAPARAAGRTYQSVAPPPLTQPSAPTNTSPSMYPPSPRAPLPGIGEIECYGCGEKGHGMSRCPALADLVNKNVITRDQGGRIVWQDGTAIRRFYGETYVQAIEKGMMMQSHLITVAEEPGYASSASENISEYSEDEDKYGDFEDVFAVRDLGRSVFEVERPEKQITARKRQVLEGVYPPRLKDLGKENRPATNPETGRPIRAGKPQTSQPTRPAEIAREKGKPRKIGEPVPLEVHKPRYDATDDKDIIEDNGRDQRSTQIKPLESSDLTGQAPKASDKRAPRKSAISAHVDPFKLLNHVLNAKVELAVGEVFAVSRELSNLLAESIKPKSTKAQVPVGLTTSGSGFRAKTRGLLIKVTMECDGNPIQAIIDTGSQLNIVNEQVCKSLIRRPIDYTAAISMNDANGGEGKLAGIVDNVPLDFGSVKTRANLYVGTHVPFDLLLGRPWQRGNLVSIDELEDGTYLVFKDPGTMVPKHKVLVTPDAISTSKWDFDPSTWYASQAPASYFVGNSPEAAPEANVVHADNPEMESRPFTPDQLALKGATDTEKIEMWQRRVELAHLIRHATRDRFETIKEGTELASSTSPPHPQFYPIMQLKIAPARVNHEAELPTLFTSPTTTRTEPETLLSGIGDIPHFSRNQHLRDIVLSSHEGLVIGHQIDPFGYHRTDMMLMKMGLVTPKFPSGNNSGTRDLDIQYGTALVHFYPNLGGPAPTNWEIPYLIPPVTQTSVSSDSTCLKRSGLNQINPEQVSSRSAVRYRPYPRPYTSASHSSSDSLALAGVSSLEEDEGEDDNDSRDLDYLYPSSDEDEAHFAGHSCVGPHLSTRPPAGSSTLPIARVSSNGDIDTDVRFPTPESLPSLESVSSSSDEENEVSKVKWSEHWQKFRAEIREELQDEVENARERRLGEWDVYQEAQQEAREVERNMAMRSILRDPLFDSSPDAAVIPNVSEPFTPTHSSSNSSTVALASSQQDYPFPPITSCDDSVMSDARLDHLEQLLERQERIDAAVEAKIDDAPPRNKMTPTDIINLARAYRLANGELTYGLNEMVPTSVNETNEPHALPVPVIPPPRPKLCIVDKENTPPRLTFSAANPPAHIFNQEPVQVFCVHIPRPSVPIPVFEGRRPPTPFPMSQQEDVNADGQNEGILRSVPPLPSCIFHLTPPTSAVPASFSDNLPRALLDVDSANQQLSRMEVKSEDGAELPSPTDTEIIDPIDQLMLPPVRRKLPTPPITVRPDNYREIRDEFMRKGQIDEDVIISDDESALSSVSIQPSACFEPHIIALTRDRVLYPFIEINRPGPITDTSIPVQERTYYPYADLDVHYNISRAERHIVVDLRDRKMACFRDEIPEGLRGVWTVLAPRNAPHGLVYPGHLWPTNFGPMDLPHVTARTLGERFEQIFEIRRLIVAFIARVKKTLAQWQVSNISSPVITLYTMSGRHLYEKKVNRAMFYRIIHPTFNPLVSRQEATLLRGACYALREFQHDIMAEAIDRLLRQPQMDQFMCGELLLRGCLEGEGDREKAYRFLEDYEAMAEGDDYESDSSSDSD